MKLNKPAKLLVGALSLWPFLYLFLFFGFIATMFFWIGRSGGASEHPSGPPIAILLLFVAHFATILLTFGLIAFYMVYLFKTDRVEQDKRALWAVVLFLGNMVAMPVFFFLYIWPDSWPRKSAPTLPGDVVGNLGAGPR